MKPAYFLILFALAPLIGSISPSQAAISAFQESSPASDFSLSPYFNPSGNTSSTYLPFIFSFYYASCPAISNNLLSLYGSSIVAYYPLWELGGSTVTDMGEHRLNGVYQGYPALGQVSALCGQAPLFDGDDDEANLLTPGLAAAFNGNEGTIILQLKIDSPQWTDGKEAYYLTLRSNDLNQIVLHKSASNQLDFTYTAGGTQLGPAIIDITTTHWITYATTWSRSKDRFIGYVAGEAYYPPQTGMGAWSGSLTSAEIAGFLGSTAHFARGSISSVILLDREASPAEIRQYSAIFGAKKVLTVLGDSISRVYMSTPWSLHVVFDYQGGNQITLKSHAVSGATIMQNMDDQVLDAAHDDADIIILALGVVDDNSGNMAALQAEVEENVTELRASNPRAVIYYLNVPPAWTDRSGDHVWDKSRIRTAIAAACVSTGITCWDTFTNPWITPSDTYDGVHLNPTGQAKIASQVLLRLQSGDESTPITP